MRILGRLPGVRRLTTKRLNAFHLDLLRVGFVRAVSGTPLEIMYLKTTGRFLVVLRGRGPENWTALVKFTQFSQGPSVAYARGHATPWEALDEVREAFLREAAFIPGKPLPEGRDDVLQTHPEEEVPG